MSLVEQQRKNVLEAVVAIAEKDLQANSNCEGREREDLLRRVAPQVAEALWVYQYAGVMNREFRSMNELNGKNDKSSNNEAKRTLIQRAQAILNEWRLDLKEGDAIHCPDYIDEYEFNDESRGFIKLYAATVEKVSEVGSWVFLGDSSSPFKLARQLAEAERGIFVKFVEFPEEEGRWIVLGPMRNDTLSMNVVPRGSHKATIRALEPAYHDDQSGVEGRGAAATDSAATCCSTGNLAVSLFSETEMKDPAAKGGKSKETKRSTSRSARKKSAVNGNVKKEKMNQNGSSTTSKSMSKPVPKKRSMDRKRGRPESEPNTMSISVATDNGMGANENGASLSKCGHDVASTGTKDLGIDLMEMQSSGNKRKRKNNKLTLEAKPAANGTKSKNAKSSRRTDVLDFTWICTECNEAECDANPDAELILCEGGCHRPFHYRCANLPAAPPSEERWICEDCQKGRHRCAFCEEYGADNEEVFCCDKEDCGLFFHESCLSMRNVEIQLSERGAEEDIDGEVGVVGKPHFICPAHSCWACTEDYVPPEEDIDDEADTKKKGKGRKKKSKVSSSFAMKRDAVLFRCLHCPTAYHLTCIPPMARFHELALLCHEHAGTHKLPDLDIESSMQAKVEAKNAKNDAKVKKKVVVQKESGGDVNHFFPGLRGDVFIGDEDRLLLFLQKEESEHEYLVEGLPFCLPVDVKNEVHSKPPSYQHVHSNQYDKSHRPKRKPPSDGKCECKSKGLTACDESCINKMIFVECVGDASKSKGEKNSYWNCDLGPECTNRSLGLKQFAKCKPMREQGKGWGLVTVCGVKKGDLVQEYVGEIIDEKEKERRLQEWTRDHPNDPNFYVMALDSGWYIDARIKANLSRFINHSCAPNCRLLPMNVNGHMRIGIYSLRDIAPGEFLSYDYQFDTKHGDKFRCRCGAPNCRGTMKGGKGEDGTNEQKTRKEEWQDAKAAYDRDVKYLEEAAEEEKKRASQVDYLVPGVENPTETVAAGPNEKKYRKAARNDRLFLWRNVVQGDVSERPPSFRQKNKGCRSTCIGREKLPTVDLLSELFKTTS